MKKYIFAALFAVCGSAIAGTCATDSTIPCSADLCVRITPPTTRESGATLANSEIKNYLITLNTLPAFTVAPGALFAYSLPVDTTLAAGSTLSAVTVDTNGLTSTTPSTCTTASAIKGKPSAPSAPALTIQ